MALTLSAMEGYVRQDLFDPAGSSQRWATTDIDRALDRAVDRYTQYYPQICFTDMQTQAYQRTYPYPNSWNASYPVMWIEKILYPLQVYGSYFNPPLTSPNAAKAAGSGLGTGVYQYLVTFLTQGGETTAGPSVSVTTTSGQQQVALTNIPIGPSTAPVGAIASNYVIGRNLYRTQVGGSTFYLLAALTDNSSTTYTDVTPDASLYTNATPPTVNTSGCMTWPPVEKNFSEYSNLYDSNNALAAGGNMGLMGLPGSDSAGPAGTQSPSFTIILSPAELPKDNTLVMRVFYATKHQLDANGSTIPEIHRDIITLGACAYAMQAYQVPTNDSFTFHDGGLRDEVDDSMIPTAWRNTYQAKIQEFEARLNEIKQQRDYAAASHAHWGDIPFRYWRL
jgi:hypothetical protein